jgi:hypothetical protein
MALSTSEREVVPVHYLFKFKESDVKTSPYDRDYEKVDEKWVVLSPELYKVVDEIVGDKYRENIQVAEALSKIYENAYVAKLITIRNFNSLPWWKRLKYLFKML